MKCVKGYLQKKTAIRRFSFATLLSKLDFAMLSNLHALGADLEAASKT
jgi:hypothetical protein